MQKIYLSIKHFFSTLFRVLYGSGYGFLQNDDSLKASALTLYTLMSIVPFLAVAFGIATGFGFESYLETQLRHAFEDQEEVVNYAIKFALTSLQTSRGSIIAGVGLLALLWTNISMLNSIESALNDIWKVKHPRSWTKKFTDYIAVMIICPIFFVVSSSLSVFLITEITKTAKESRLIEFVSPFLLFLLNAAPFFLSILLFIVIYLFIPNVRIRAKPRIAAGILAGVAFQLWQWLYIKFQYEITSYSTVYGTLAALPLFLIWLQVSWIIVLAGAELAATMENELVYTVKKPGKRQRTISEQEFGLLILHYCIQAYLEGNQPPNALQIAREFGVPLFTVQQMLDTLERVGILVEVSMPGASRIGLQPSRDASLFTIKDVCDAIKKQQGWNITVEDSPILQKIEKSLKEFDRLIIESTANLNLKQI